MINLTPTQLRLAADLKEKIAGLETQLAGLEDGKASSPVQASKPAKRGMSVAGRAKIAAAAKARWAKVRAAKAKTSPKVIVAAEPAKKKFVMSAAAKAKISAAAKTRWAKVKAAKK